MIKVDVKIKVDKYLETDGYIYIYIYANHHERWGLFSYLCLYTHIMGMRVRTTSTGK
jgi:hypothetical protein